LNNEKALRPEHEVAVRTQQIIDLEEVLSTLTPEELSMVAEFVSTLRVEHTPAP
jgi:hypothetical protein